MLVDVYECVECGSFFYVEDNQDVEITPCCGSEYFEYSHTTKYNVHNLKILPEFFKEVIEGNKTFEIRKNDRNFKLNDIVILREYEPKNKNYTGRQVFGQITYITDFEQKKDFVVFAMKLATFRGEVYCMNTKS